MKTGNTDAAGYCLIASAKRGPRRLLSVVLGAGSDTARASESQKLLNYGFQFYDTVQMYQNGQTINTLRVWKGATDSVTAGFVADQYLTLPKGQAQKLKLTHGGDRAADRAGHAGTARRRGARHARRQVGRRISAAGAR